MTMDGNLIYVKTPAGTAEVTARTAQLTMITRRVLIMMDGRRTVDELSTLVRPGEIDSIIEQLETAGFAYRTAESKTVGGSAGAEPRVDATMPASDASAASYDRDFAPMTLDEAKRRAVRELTDRLGPQAEVVAMRMEQCRSIEEFRDRMREAERCVAAALGANAAQEYLRALRRKT
jgi:hypothetical protein